VHDHDTTCGVYWRVTRPEVRRAMSLQDFNPASATYGCCDRSFWHYRTISSFPAATMQQVALPFAVLFDSPFAGNNWHHDDEMFERARAAMLFWSRAQHASGAVDEWYRNEHSYCATAFTTFGVAEACLRLRSHLAPADRDIVERALARSAQWLGDRFNDEVMNQNLAAAAALWNVHLLTGDRRFKIGYERTWQRTRGYQSREGWFAEYEGADLGYSLLAMDLLASLDRRGSPDAAPAAASLCGFVASFALSGVDLAGRLGSRGTDHSFPFGAEVFAATFPAAGAVARHLRRAVDDATSDPRTVDDRYLAYFYLPSFVMASSVESQSMPCGESPAVSAVFEESGFHIWRKRQSDVVCSTRRNAAFNLYAPARPVHRNLGYWVEDVDGRRFASCPWSTDATEARRDANGVVVEGEFVRVDDTLPLLKHEVAFRAATRWVFRTPSIAETFHRFIKRRKITRKVAGPIAFTRELRWHDDALIVSDTLRLREGGPTLRAVTPTDDIEVHSPSARQSGASATHVIRVPRSVSESWAERLNNTGALELVTVYKMDDDGVVTSVAIQQRSEWVIGASGDAVPGMVNAR
jgi:hypothetical protein